MLAEQCITHKKDRRTLLQSQDLRIGQKKELYIRISTRKLNEVLSTKLFMLN